MQQRSKQCRIIIDKRPAGSRAFTLVELLVALTIGSLVVVSIVSATRALSNTRENVDRRIMRTSSAQTAMDTIVAALRNVSRDAIPHQPTVVGHRGEPISGDHINLQVISDIRARSDGQESDQYEVSFYLQVLEGQRLPSLLCRKDHALDDEFEEGGLATVIADGIIGLMFQYLRSGTEWVDEWSELESEVPKAVRATVIVTDAVFRDIHTTPDVTVLSTVVPIHIRSRQQSRNNQADQSSGGER